MNRKPKLIKVRCEPRVRKLRVVSFFFFLLKLNRGRNRAGVCTCVCILIYLSKNFITAIERGGKKQDRLFHFAKNRVKCPFVLFFCVFLGVGHPIENYVHVVLGIAAVRSLREGERKVAQRKNRVRQREKEMMIAYSATHIPRPIYVNGYIHRTVSLFDYF